MKKILAASFLATFDEPVMSGDCMPDKEFYAILSLIAGTLVFFGLMVHIL